jgi:CDGSH-type Zn-finger protein
MVIITVRPDSSLKVEGDFKIQKADGTEIPHNGNAAFLCRCGHSNNKPFCDSTHKKIEFKAD